MSINEFKFYYVTVERAKNSKKPLECYGCHETIDNALTDQLNRAYNYNQKTSIYGVKGDNSIHFIS